ncbi:MAG: PAS domain S-box protein [Opitutaceae bacterium]
MKITVNVESDLLNRVIKTTGSETTTAAIDYALRELDRQARQTEELSPNTEASACTLSESKEIEETLRESEEINRATFEQAAIGIAHVGSEGAWLRINDKLCAIVGYTREELMNLTFQDITHPEDLDEDLSYVEQMLSGEINQYSIEKRYIRKDHSVVWIHLSVSLVRTASGKPRHFISVVEDITAQKQAKEEIARSARHLTLAQSTALLGSWELTIATDELFWSDMAFELFGLNHEKDKLTLDKFFEMVHPEDRQIVHEAFQSSLVAGGPPYNITHRIIRVDTEEIRYLQERCIHHRDANGNVIKSIGTVQDVTVQEKAEEKLKKSEEHFKSIVEQSPLSTQMFTPDGMTAQVNRAYENLWGITIGDLEGYNILEDQQLVSLGIMPYIQGAFSGQAASIPAAEFDTAKSLGIGNKMWIQARIYPVKDSAGNINNVILIHEDITERKQAEESLRVSEEKLRLIIDTSPIGICTVDSLGNYAMVNPAYEQMLGYTKEELRSLTLFDVTHPEDRPKNKALYQSMFTLKSTGFFVEKRYMRKDDKIINVAVNATAVMDTEGRVIFGTAFVRDITKWKLAEDELIQAKEKAETSDRLKSAFLANTSHEIRTPLNAIVNFSRMLTWEDEISNQEKKEYADIVESSCTSLLKLIDDILDISKIESGSLEIRKETTDLRVLLSNLSLAYEMNRNANPKVSIRLELPEETTALKLLTDENRLKQVLINLVDNALKCTELGHVTIGATLESDRVIIYVEDTGIGISKEHRTAIFERFYKIDSGANKLYRGVGLGLAISSKIIKLLGGRLNVDSELGRGSKFFFSLPLTLKNTESPKMESSKEGNMNRGALKGLKLLVVEDEPANMMVLQVLLKDSGAKIGKATTGEDAVNLYTETLPDVVLMDLKLPKIDGFEATKRIFEINSEAIIIAQSAFAGTDYQEKAVALGFAGYVTKPIVRAQLIESILNAIV